MLFRTSNTHRALGSLTAGLVLSVVGLGAFATGAGAATPTTAPLPCIGYDTDGFTVFVQGDVSLGNDETEGSVALGGDLTLASSGDALIHSSTLTPTGYSLPVVDGDRTRLLVGGTLEKSSTGTLQVTSRDDTGSADPATSVGGIKFGDTNGLDFTTQRKPNRLYVADDQGASPWVDVSEAANQTLDGAPHPVTYPEAASVVTSRFPELFTEGQTLAGLTDPTSANYATATIAGGSDDGVITLTAGAFNVLNISADALSKYTALTFAGATPGEGTGFVVNVTGDRSNVHIPPLRGAAMPGQPDAQHPNPWAPYVTWNLTGAGTSSVTGELVTGTILAPDVDLTLDASSPVEGQVIAKTLVTEGGEIHTYLSATECDGPTPTPTPTPTQSPTTSPTPTPTTTTAAPQPSPTDTATTPAPAPTTTAPATTTASAAPTSSTPTATTVVLATDVTASPTAPTTGGLATTGASMLPAVIAGLLIAAGLALLVVRRRIARG